MALSNDLFGLVKSLTKTEKRYFKLHVLLQEGNKSYMKLFDAFDKLKEYDEIALRQKLKEESFLRRISAVKKYLYLMILKSLRHYHEEANIRNVLGERFKEIRILVGKGLIHQSKKILLKTKKLAYKHDQFPFAMDIVGLEADILYKTLHKETDASKIGLLLDEQMELIKRYVNRIKYLYYNGKTVLFEHLFSGNDKEMLKKIKKITSNKLFQNENQALSHIAKQTYYTTHLVAYWHSGDLLNQYRLSKAMLRNTKENFYVGIGIANIYIKHYYNFLICCIHIYNYDEFILSIREFKEIPVKTNDEKALVTIYFYALVFLLHIKMGDFEKALPSISESKKIMRLFQNRPIRFDELNYYFLLGILFFGCKQYGKSFSMLNKLFNERNIEIAKDIISTSVILMLLISFEQEDSVFSEGALKKANHYFEKKKMIYKAENSILSFITKHTEETYSKAEWKKLFIPLKIDLEKIVKNPVEAKALAQFDYISWLQSKIENRTFAEVVREKAEKLKNKAVIPSSKI